MSDRHNSRGDWLPANNKQQPVVAASMLVFPHARTQGMVFAPLTANDGNLVRLKVKRRWVYRK